MTGDAEEAALTSIAEVITEARALVDHGNDVYNQALVDLTMARLQPDVEFLILGDPAPAMPVEATRPTPPVEPVKAKRERAVTFVTDGPRGGRGSVRHVSEDCPRIRQGYSPATYKETRTLPLCLQCRG